MDWLSRSGVFRDIIFEVPAGETGALAGLVGAGCTEVARVVARNVTLTLHTKYATAVLFNGAAERHATQEWSKRLQVKTGSKEYPVSTPSGGNQQKVVLAKSEVHRLISDLAGRGMAILMISSERPEVLGAADRVLVIREGRITGEVDRANAKPELVTPAATSSAGGIL